MGIIIAKTVISTIDIILVILMIASSDKQARKTIGIGAAVWVALNITAMWL